MSNYLYTDTGNLPEGFEDPGMKISNAGFSNTDPERKWRHELNKKYPSSISQAEAAMNIIRSNPKPYNFENNI